MQRITNNKKWIWDNIKVDEKGCWVWKKYIAPDGYAKTSRENKCIPIHRISYEAHNGKIKKGFVIDHLCKNRACQNPSHLEAVTHKENNNRSNLNTKKTHCIRGHLLVGENLLARKGGRFCKICNRIFQKNYSLRKKTIWQKKKK